MGMSAAVAFDTLKFVRKLEAGGFTQSQAAAAAEAFAEATSQELATRADLKTEIAAVRAELRETELRLEAKIEAAKTDIVKWLFGTIGFQTLVILGAVLALARIVHP
jgi:hypothetical protein